jgi:hypothetical protein
MDNIIGMTVQEAKNKGHIIRVTSVDGKSIPSDKKYMPSRRNVQTENGIIISVSSHNS